VKRSSQGRNRGPTHFRERNELKGVVKARTARRLIALVFPLLLPFLPAGNPVVLRSSTQMAVDSVESLRSLGQFTVTARGETLESFPSKRHCLYFEWAAGYKRNGDWAERILTSHSGKSLTMVTPRGLLEAPFASLRLYLPVSAAYRYTRQDGANAPELLREQLERDGRTIDLEEILLEEGRTYHAMVDKDSKLAISDMPFKEGKPQRALTPAYAQD
jgi:hypothetical protein